MAKDLRFKIKQNLKMFLQNIYLPIVYRANSLKPVDEGLVVFADCHHKKRPESMARLVSAAKAKRELKVLEWYRDFSEMSAYAQFSDSVAFMRLYARARAVVICDNFLPVASCKKRKKTKVIQLWHGPGAFKKFGYDSDDDIPSFYKGNVYKNYDLVTVSGTKCVEPFTSAMRQPEGVVRPIGISRMDSCVREVYKDKCISQFYEKYPEARGKKILLWAPTFRGNAGRPYLCGLEEMEALKKSLSEDWFVILSIHPHLIPHLNREDLKTKLPTERMIPVCDVFVTDYSSIMYDACLLKKKMLMFAPDLEEFAKSRGTYMQPSDFPGEIITDGKKLKEAVIRTYEAYDLSKQEKFIDDWLTACDGHATERILDFIMEDK